MCKNLKTRSEIKTICPSAKTIEETYSDDEGYVQLICKELECDKTELLLTKDEYQLVTSDYK